MTAIAWLNGELVERERASVSIDDLGFRYGAACFETFRAYRGVPFRLDRHLARLAAGLALLGIAAPAEQELGAAVEVALRANGLPAARVRLTVSAGPDGGTRRLADAGPPTVLVVVEAAPAAPSPVIALVTSTRIDERDPLRRAKTSNYLPSLLALAEARAAGCEHALLRNIAGDIAEAATANVFAVVEGVLRTPPLDAGALPGITREAVLECARALGLPAEEGALSVPALAHAAEAFVTSAGAGVQPLAGVRLADGSAFEFAAAPERCTVALDRAYRDLVARETAPPATF